MKKISFKMNSQNTDEIIYEDSFVRIFYLNDDLYKVHYPEKWEDYADYVSPIINMYDWYKIKEFLKNQPERLNPETSKEDAIV